jgi:hypothetical protein
MNRDDIVRMAQEVAGVTYPDGTTGVKIGMSEEHLERFANLVAAAEREEIAQMIEDSPPLVSFAQNEMGGCVVCGFTPKLAALTIRERGAP